MKRRTTLLRVGVAALVCCGALGLLSQGVAQQVQQPKAQPAIQFQPQTGGSTTQVKPALPNPFVQVPPNGVPFQVPPGVGPIGGFGPNGGFTPPVGIPGPVPGGKFKGPLPSATVPVAYTTKEGKTGWKVMIPGNRPLATPAVVDGNVFVGGGFGSYEFYSLDAKSGKQNWVYRTGDDGPTAAVVSDGYIAFNTESCEIEIITFAGKKVWKKWLGDPLMSMPAISQGKVYQSYPGAGGHLIACFDLKTGKEFWKKNIPGQIVTAPIISKGQLYITTLEGSMTCMDGRDGTVVWQEKKNATSAPVVWNGQVYFSRRDTVQLKNSDGKVVSQEMEGIAGKAVTKDSLVKDFEGTKQHADYLDIKKRIQFSPMQITYQKNDASVGFGGATTGGNVGGFIPAGVPAGGIGGGIPAGPIANTPIAGPVGVPATTAPPVPSLAMIGGIPGGGAAGNIGQNTVNGVWAYQGSKPFIYNNLLYTCMGDVCKCVDPKTEKVQWQKDLKNPGKKGPLVDATLTPPAIVNGKLFMGTSAGQIICMSATTGAVLWTATVEGSISFQPAVANGMVYVSTNNGGLFAIETGDANDNGWLMWGANAAHNGGID